MECSQCTEVHFCPNIKSQACLGLCLSDVSHYPSFVMKARVIHSLCINKTYHISKEPSHPSTFQSHSISGDIYQKIRITINHLWDGSQNPMLPLIQFVSKQSILFFLWKYFWAGEKKISCIWQTCPATCLISRVRFTAWPVHNWRNWEREKERPSDVCVCWLRAYVSQPI